MNEMTPEQALGLLTQVTASVTANRDVHSSILRALEVLKKAIKENESIQPEST